MSMVSYKFCHQCCFHDRRILIQGRLLNDLYLEDFLIFSTGRLEVFFFGLVGFGGLPAAPLFLSFPVSCLRRHLEPASSCENLTGRLDQKHLVGFQTEFLVLRFPDQFGGEVIGAGRLEDLTSSMRTHEHKRQAI